ncbi:13608_t:CDS:2, partial [Funneliformis geosporum]
MSKEFISEELEELEELETLLPSHYELDRDKLEVTHVDGVPITIEDFEELATTLPFPLKLELTDDKIVMIPVHNLTERLILLLKLPYGAEITLDSLDGTEVAKWNALSPNDQNKAFPTVSPNFVAEIRSSSDSEDYCHQKMLDYINADVEEGILIDPINRTLTIYRVDRNGDIVWNTRRNTRTFTFQILNGFVLNLQ